jgi:hypothetical protein
MRKLIDIPDEIVKELKLIAVKNDTDLKNYIQDLILDQYQFTKKTEMAIEGIQDGQAMRFIWNYLRNTYEGIKDNVFQHDEEFKFKDELDFFEYVKYVCECVIQSIKNDEEHGL